MACGFCILFFAICRISCKNSRYFFNEPQKNPQPISILWKRAVDFSFNTTPPRCSLASAGGILHQTSEQLNHRIGSFRLQIIRQKLLNFSHIFRNHCLVAANDFIKSKAKRERPKLSAGKTVKLKFLGTGMISVMPVPLLAVHPRECSPQGRTRYVPSVCACRWTCPVHLHRLP